MSGLPQSTEVRRVLPKAGLYRRFGWKPSQRESFDGDVARLDFMNWIAPRTLPAVAEGAEVKEIYMLSKFRSNIATLTSKLLGLTTEVNELQGNWIYKANDKGEYSPADIISGTCSLSVLGKGRWIKKAFNTDTPVQMYSFYELYPVKIEFLTVEEAKSVYANPPSERIQISAHVTPLSPAVQRMVDVCRSK